jgi:retron-type reverse transcriptase
VNVGEMQKKLSQWAEQDKNRTFADLHNLLYDMKWLHTAYQHVRRNAGRNTAGTDGMTIKRFEEHLEDNLLKLSQTLKARAFKPTPVRRVYIPKSDGKKRPLGIPMCVAYCIS